jgi:hypothetical protein
MPVETALSATIAEPAAEFHGLADAFVDVAERALASGDFSRTPSSEIERVITAAMKLYAAKAEAEGTFPAPVSAERITPTEVVIVVSELLRASNLNLFDLAMWYRRAR